MPSLKKLQQNLIRNIKKKKINKKKIKANWNGEGVECECSILSLWSPCKERLILPFKKVLHFFLPSHIFLSSGILLKLPRLRLSPKTRWCIFLPFVPSPFLSYLGQSILRTMSSHACSLQGLSIVWEDINAAAVLTILIQIYMKSTSFTES